MRDQWKDRHKPNLDNITSLFENEDLGAFIAGHLLLESVMVQLLELKLTAADTISLFDLSFASKVNMAKSRGLISEKLADFLLEINAFRNRLAHRLAEPIVFEGMYKLAQNASNAGIEFSDDMIHLDFNKSREWYGVHGIIQELFQNAALDLSFLMEDHGGTFQFS